jgi:hypothetical protein
VGQLLGLGVASHPYLEKLPLSAALFEDDLGVGGLVAAGTGKSGHNGFIGRAIDAANGDHADSSSGGGLSERALELISTGAERLRSYREIKGDVGAETGVDAASLSNSAAGQYQSEENYGEVLHVVPTLPWDRAGGGGWDRPHGIHQASQ